MMRTGRDETDGRRHRPNRPEKADMANDNPLGLLELSLPEPRRRWRWIGLFTFVLVSMAMLATVIVVTIARDKKTSLLQAEENRLQESISGRVKILETWLDGQQSASRRLTKSHVFRLFITDLAAQDPRLPLPRSLQDQQPYFQQLMADFAEQNDLVRATVLRDDGAILLSSPGPALPVADLLQQSEDAEIGWHTLYSPMRRIDDRGPEFVVDALVAIPETQAEDNSAIDPSAHLVLTLNINPILETILSNKLADPNHEEIAIFQRRGKAIDKIWATPKGLRLEVNKAPNGIDPDVSAAFGRRSADHPVYSLAEPINGVRWGLYQALDARLALDPVHQFIAIAATLSGMAVLALTVAFSSLWWRQERNHHRELVRIYRDHAESVDRQRQFLQSVTTSIEDWLTVTGPNGKIIYANPSFEAVVQHLTLSATGKLWEDLIKVPSANQPLQDDLASLVDAHSFEIIEIGDEQHIISSKASELRAEDGSIRGTVRVVRDQSELVMERRLRLQSLAQTVNAFIHAVELRDPFLLGHTQRVRTHAIAIGAKLGVSQDGLAALALAASLSQIGKIFIPDDILRKPDRHDPAEEEVMRHHILHAVNILKPIEFDLPVIEILSQMHERLDGSGYPHGLTGNQIGMNARILAIADVFCARTAPRSYRDQLSIGKALFHLANNDQRYDLKVVAVLAGIVGTSQEIDDPDTIENTFIDSPIWQKRNRQHNNIRAPA